MDSRLYDLFFEQEDRHWWFQGRRRIVLGQVRIWLGWRGGLRILDLGCGTGGTLQAMRPLGEVWGLDCSRQALEYCRRRGLDRLVQGNFPCALPAAVPAGFDLITALDMLEHLSDDDGALRHIFRLLRPGGFVLITVPAFAFLWSPHDRANHHLRRYTRRQLSRRLAAAGFRIRKLSYFNFFLFFPAWLRKRCDAWRYGDHPVSHLEALPPPALGQALLALFRLEGWLLRKLSFPFGVSLLAVAEKPPTGRD